MDITEREIKCCKIGLNNYKINSKIELSKYPTVSGNHTTLKTVYGHLIVDLSDSSKLQTLTAVDKPLTRGSGSPK